VFALAANSIRTSLLSLLAVALLAGLVVKPAHAATLEKHVLTIQTSTGTERIFAEISRGQTGHPAFVLLNGLIYDIHRWDKVTDELIARGETVVRYAYSGQPENLRLLKKGEVPAYFNQGLSLEDLSNELDQVITQLRVGPRVQVVGLSYGSSVASEFAVRHPEKVESLILLAPLVVPPEAYDINGYWFRAWLNSIRSSENSPCDFYGVVNPYLCASKDYWFDTFYNYYYDNFLNDRIANVPTDVDETMFKKAVFHLVRAARDFDLRSYAPRLKNVYLVEAGADEIVVRDDQERAWKELPVEGRRSLVVVRGAAHALPDTAPARTSEVLIGIANRAPELQTGKRLEVSGDDESGNSAGNGTQADK
jgi:pimeloyl-ACP methyl ester carboxylesterase